LSTLVAFEITVTILHIKR